MAKGRLFGLSALLVTVGLVVVACGEPQVREVSTTSEASPPETEATVLEAVSEDRFEADALLARAQASDAAGRLDEVLSILEEIVTRFGEATDPLVMQVVAKAMHNTGTTLGEMGRVEEALVASDEAITRFGSSTDPVLLGAVAGSVVNKAVALGELGRAEEALVAYDAVITRFGQADEQVLVQSVAGALFNKGVELQQLGRLEEAVAVYEEVTARLGESKDPIVMQEVARACQCGERAWITGSP